MKLKRGRNKPTVPKFNVEVSHAVSDLFPLLLGVELIHRIPAQVYFNTLNLDPSVLEPLFYGQYIAGSKDSWVIAKKYYDKAAEVLTQKTKLTLKPSTSGENTPPPVLALVRAYKRLLAGKLRECDTAPKLKSIFPFFRAMSKRHSPEFVLSSMQPFFAQQAMNVNPSYELWSFDRFLLKLSGQKKR